MKLGHIEKGIYALRAEHPLVIPQLDPEKYDEHDLQTVLKELGEIGVSHVAVGGTIVDAAKMQAVLDIVAKDFGFVTLSYITNNSLGLLNGIKGKTAVYWMSVLNAENLYFLRDNLIMNSIAMSKKNFELLPTAYVFDERGSCSSSNWLARSTPIPRNKAELSLAIALAAQYLGMRFYIMAGGSGAPYPPPVEHVKLISKKTDLFLIPTSGINQVGQAKRLFANGADAIHVGKAIELKNGLKMLRDMVKISKKHDGKEFS
ncbi:MAG: geranylgeranylglyceryl/heptaprenylglyceryl phosphate synthase [Candidatus Diapherotrites archaeon]